MFLYRRLRLTKCPIGQVAPLYLGPVCEGQKKEKKPKPSPELDFKMIRIEAGLALRWFKKLELEMPQEIRCPAL